MKVFDKEVVAICDIDDALVMHNQHQEIPEGDEILIEDHIKNGEFIRMQINKPMVRILEEEIFRGSLVIVASRSGYKWAENVLKALKLDHHDVIVITKPRHYFDDKDVSHWLKDRVYLPPETVYKNINKG